MENNKWVSAEYEFHGMMLAPDKAYVLDKHKGYVLTFTQEEESLIDGYKWFWFIGRERNTTNPDAVG